MANNLRPPVLTQSTVEIDLSDIDCAASPKPKRRENKENLAHLSMHKQNSKERVYTVSRTNSIELAPACED